jgi:Zn-dependent peptidase ImmA (M78 family)
MRWLKNWVGSTGSALMSLDFAPDLKPDWNKALAEAYKLTAVYNSPPIPVLEIAERLGLSVGIAKFGKYSKDVSGFIDFSEKRIHVNEDDSFNRKLFTIAHEIGHWVLHREHFIKDTNEYVVLARQTGIKQNNYEQEANAFAAALLVPEGLLKPVKSYGAATLASIFLVSREMMEHRLKHVR